MFFFVKPDNVLTGLTQFLAFLIEGKTVALLRDPKSKKWSKTQW